MIRAIRRHHKRRMKAKARRVFPGWPRPEIAADYLAKCSAHLCCGNMRKAFGPTRREVRFMQENDDG